MSESESKAPSPVEAEDSAETIDAAELLRTSVAQFKERFDQERSLLSFDEYLAIVAESPELQARDTARYLRDCFLYYGTEEVHRPYGSYNRFLLFDCPFDEGRDPLVGHEAAQAAVYGHLNDFAVHGRVNNLILLNGPNGSAKSRFISCVMRAMEDYSEQEEGALYTFSWVFPREALDTGNIGFASKGKSTDDLDTYAHLNEGDIDARLFNETRDHPLLLLPKTERLEFLRACLGEDYPLPLSLADGELSPKARQIFDALLKAYHGDLSEVLKHIQIERMTISRRYRRSAVTVDPQMRVDAGVRQVTADRSLGSLPPSLQNLTLYEPMGDLVDANRGVLEFNDLLKRPVEAFKYILSTCEKGTVRLDTMTLYLDTVFLGSCNAEHLTAFKQIPDFASFKARTELVTVPYLLDYPLESQIYWDLLRTLSAAVDIGPHVPNVVALWAVLCRLERPATYRDQDKGVQEALSQLTPYDKAHMYAGGVPPSGLTREVEYQLRTTIPEIYAEHTTSEGYEGRFGPSPRELKGLLLNGARHSHGAFTGVGVLGALRELCEQRAVYPFLSLETDGEYHNPLRSIGIVRSWYLATVEEELHQAIGLVDHDATTVLLAQYIDHVVHHIRKERRTNSVTGRSEEPDSGLMRDVERKLDIPSDAADRYRESLVHRIAAWRMENPPEVELDYGVIFADIVGGLNDAFYEEKRKTADRIKGNLLSYLTEEDPSLTEAEKEQAEIILTRFDEEFGYPRSCAIEVISCLLKARGPREEESEEAEPQADAESEDK